MLDILLGLKKQNKKAFKHLMGKEPGGKEDAQVLDLILLYQPTVFISVYTVSYWFLNRH